MSDPKTLAPHDQGPSLDKTNRTNTQDSARQFMIPHLAPLTDAHVSSYYPDALMCRSTLSQEPPSSKSTSSGSQSCKNCPVSSVSTKLDNHESEPLEWLKFRLASGFFAYFLCGWGDGVTGTILPYFTTAFHLNTMTSSLLFTGSTCGFFIGTFIVERVMMFLGQCSSECSTTSLTPYIPWLSSMIQPKKDIPVARYSASQARHLSLIFASVLHAAFFVMVGFQGSYAVTWLAYAIAALARSFITDVSATLNAYFVSGPPQSSVGYAYGLWSVGGMLSPIVCQTIIAKGVHWSHFYFGSLVLSGINLTLIYWAFRPTAREIAREWSEAESEKISTPVQSSVATPDIARSSRNNYKAAPLASRSHTLHLALKMPYLWAFSIFALLYSGNETTTQGFMVTYLLGARRANPKTVGYVTSGYWGGFALARFIWGTFVLRSSFTQRKFIVLGCLTESTFRTLALIMHVLIRVINSNIENSLSVALVGLFYGSIFPAILRLTNDILPSEVHMISMGLISAFASVGSALFPFISGSISNVKGVTSIPYLTISLGVILIGIWSSFPTHLPPSRVDNVV